MELAQGCFGGTGMYAKIYPRSLQLVRTYVLYVLLTDILGYIPWNRP